MSEAVTVTLVVGCFCILAFCLLGVGAWIWARALVASLNVLLNANQIRDVLTQNEVVETAGWNDEDRGDREPLAPPPRNLTISDREIREAIHGTQQRRRQKQDEDRVRTTDENAGFDIEDEEPVGGTTPYRKNGRPEGDTVAR